MTLIKWISLISSIIGIISFIWYIKEKKFQFKKISWKKAQRSSVKIADNLVSDNFRPSFIFGIGRGGAIFGSMISGCLGHCPLIVIDRKYTWMEQGRLQDMIFPINIPSDYLKHVLLVAGEAHSGLTMAHYYNFLISIGAKNIKKAVLFYEEECPTLVEYYGIKSDRKNIILPWMFSKRYSRTDRKPTSIVKSDAKIKLYLIRHAQTSAGEDIFSGLIDYDLTIKGIEQALKIGHSLSSKNIKSIFSSPLGRSIKTAKIIKDSLPNAQFIINDNLKEIEYGCWDGLSHQSVKEKFRNKYDRWLKDPYITVPEKGEKPECVIERFNEFLKEVTQRYSIYDNTELVVVTHKSLMRLFLSYINREPLHKYRNIEIKNCSIITLVFNGQNWESA